jgi:hypothetical protein
MKKGTRGVDKRKNLKGDRMEETWIKKMEKRGRECSTYIKTVMYFF